MITQNGESSHDLLLSVTNRKALAPGGTATPAPPFKTLITNYYQSLPHNSTRSWVLVSTLIGYLLIDGLDCLTVKYLAGIKGCSSETRFISSIFRLLCIALWHYVREVILYTVYSDCVLVFAFAFLSCKK